MARYCSECGNKVAENVRFCSNCGAEIQGSRQEPSNQNQQRQNMQMNYPPLQPPPGVGYNLDPTIEEMFFKNHGRLNRLRYFKRSLVLDFIYIAILCLVLFVLDIDFGSDEADYVTAFVGVMTLYPEYCLLVRRIEDLNRGRKEALILILVGEAFHLMGIFAVDFDKPGSIIRFLWYVGVYDCIMLYIMLKDGTHGPNQYGEDPLHRYPQNDEHN